MSPSDSPHCAAAEPCAAAPLVSRVAMNLFILVAVVGLALAGCANNAPSGARRPPASTTSRAWPDVPPNDIALHALGLVGTPYRFGGNTPEGGFDCSGLIGYLYRNDSGIALPRTVARLASTGQRVDPAELRGGDLVLFGAGRVPTHAGIYVGAGRFVHAPSTGGAVRLDRLQSAYWARQFIELRRP